MTTLFYFLLFSLIKITFSVDCASLKTENDCNIYAQCDWKGGSAIDCSNWVLSTGQPLSECKLCVCNSQVPLDIVFTIDSSGSIGSSNFELQRKWLVSIFNGKISQDSRIGFIIFASFVNDTATKGCTDSGWSGTGRICYWPENKNKFGEPDMTSSLVTFVESIRYTTGTTITQKAVEKGIRWLVAYGKPNRKHLIILITDGQPNRPSGNVTVCQHSDAIFANDIQVVIVGVGSGWESQNGPDKVRCLVRSNDDMFYVKTFADFDQIDGGFFEKLCPALNDLLITEIKVEKSDNTNNGILSNRETDKWRGRFLEIKNIGKDLDISQISIGGFVKSTSDNFFYASDANSVLIPAGHYLVFYESYSSDNDISCYKCDGCTKVETCTEPVGFTWTSSEPKDWGNYPTTIDCQVTNTDGITTVGGVDTTQNGFGGRCYGTTANDNPAVYIPCPLCSSNTFGPYGCCIDDSMNNTNWYVSINDTQGVITKLDQVVYGTDNIANITSNTWPVVIPGYSYSLKSTTANNDIGQNWAQSCYEWGTPGTTPIANCPPKCTQNSCTNQNRSDTNAVCQQNGKCSCSVGNGYYSSGIVCLPIPTVAICFAFWDKDTENVNKSINPHPEEWVMRFKWSRALTLTPLYKVNYPGKFGSGTENDQSVPGFLQEEAVDVTDDLIYWRGEHQIAGTVRVKVIDADGNEQLGPTTNCLATTDSPTAAPTNEPTPGPTPGPTNSPTPSPTAGPRACFWQGCTTNIDHFRANVDFCECKIRNKQNEFNPPGFDKKCCVWNETWDMGGSKLGSVNGKSLECDLNPRYWLPSEKPEILKVKCTKSSTVDTTLFWEIYFFERYCFENCPAGSNTNSNANPNAQQRRRLNANTTNIDNGDFTLTPDSGNITINASTFPPVGTISILVETRAQPNTEDGEFVSVYFANLTGCINVGDSDPDCHVTYPNPIALYVSATKFCSGSRQCANTKEEKIPPYVWWIIAGLVVFLILLALLVWYFWCRIAKAKQNIDEACEDIKNEEEQIQENVIDGLNTGDVCFNPIATMNTNIAVDSNPLGAAQNELANNAENEWAYEDDKKFKYNQEFGQIGGGNPHT